MDEHLKSTNALLFGWDNFRELIKSKWRYTFFLETKSYGVYKNCLSPVETLETITELFKTHRGIIKDLPAGTSIFRGRSFKYLDNYDNAKSLGTPPVYCAKEANRFSPIGQPDFYGAFDDETIKREINSIDDYLVIGEFYNSRTIKILDLTDVSEPQEPYNYSNPDTLALLFLSGLSKAVSNPVCDSLGLDYIPTQVFAEYIRRIRIAYSKIRGIKYWSAKDSNGKNIVLFYSNQQCVDATKDNKDCLVLKDCCVYTRNVSFDVYEPLATMY